MTSKKNKDKNNPSFLWSLLSAIAYGLWAFFINKDKLGASAIISALTQFLLSFFAASFLTFSMSAVLRAGSAPVYKVLAVIVPMNFVALTFSFVHFIAGTPNIIETILPSYIIGHVLCTLFVIFYTYGK